jgi:hypothetical protein
LRSWNHGQYEQWLSFGFWGVIFAKILLIVSFFIPVVIISIWRSKWRWSIFFDKKIIYFCAFIIPVFLFSNLFFRHDYYFYSNAVLLILFISSITDWEFCSRRIIFLCFLTSLLFSGSYLMIKKNYFVPGDINTIELLNSIPNKDPIIILDGGFSSFIPFMTERKALMLSDDLEISNLSSIVEANKNIKWAAIVVKNSDSELPELVLNSFGLNFKNVYKVDNGGLIYTSELISEKKIETSNHEFNKFIKLYDDLKQNKQAPTFGPFEKIKFSLFFNGEFSPDFELIIVRNKSKFYINVFSPIILRFGDL